MRFLKLLLLVTVMGLWNPAFAQTDEDIMQMSIAELGSKQTGHRDLGHAAG